MALVKVRPQNYFHSILYFDCPGCFLRHTVRVASENQPAEEWNGDLDSPTVHIPIWSNMNQGNPTLPVCHCYIKDGYLDFLRDSTHGLRGLRVPMVHID